MADPVWLAVAKTLPAGRRIRIKCCAADTSLMVSNEAKGFRAYCFRCGPAGFVAHGDFSIDQLRRRKEELAWQQTRTVSLPNDFTTVIPPSEATWLYRAGISHDIAKHYGFGYSATMKRVVLPVYKDGKLDGYTARSTINERPKYLERAPFDAYFASDPFVRLPDNGSESRLEDLCVYTEDILSAVRVGRVSGQAYALMGTTISAELLSASTRVDVQHVVWLDPDKAGKKGSRLVARSLELQGCAVRVIKSAKDPKYYSNREIRRLLTQ